jgi:alkanesulfonate monooxygenase SsuD/methylene tetrahydromethanopterin reductase-like flavin-dependent oxidoreductase (luciferase family)
MLRPRPYTRPHPPIIRAASGEASMLALARQGRPFLLNVQSLAVTRRRFERYREAMRDAGFGEEQTAACLAQCWVWRNVLVAETDAEAARIGVPAFAAMAASRAEMRNRVFRETGLRIEVPASDLPAARASVEDGFIHGAPATVRAAVAELAALGVGGMLASFRIGPLSHRAATASLSLFMREVAPAFRTNDAGT